MNTDETRSAGAARCREALTKRLAAHTPRGSAPAIDVDLMVRLNRRTSELLARTARFLDAKSNCDYAEDPELPEVCVTCRSVKAEACRREQSGDPT